MSDLLCWLHVLIVQILTLKGMAIVNEVKAMTYLLVLPINSAVNPFLYLLAVVLEKRRKAREEEMLKVLEKEMANSQKCNSL